MCVSPRVLVWFQLSGPWHAESGNFSEVFCFGSDSILSIVPHSAQNVCMRRICGCDCLLRPSHNLCRWPHSRLQHTHPFYRHSAWVLLLVLTYLASWCTESVYLQRAVDIFWGFSVSVLSLVSVYVYARVYIRVFFCAPMCIYAQRMCVSSST